MKFFILLLITFGLLLSCADDSNESITPEEQASEPCDPAISLEADILPVINSQCALSGCHLDSQLPLLNSTGDIIQNTERINARVVAGTMPPSRPLSRATVDLIACWVENGATDN